VVLAWEFWLGILGLGILPWDYWVGDLLALGFWLGIVSVVAYACGFLSVPYCYTIPYHNAANQSSSFIIQSQACRLDFRD